MIGTVAQARITIERGTTMWRCPSCGRILGELRDGTVIVKAGERYLMILLTSVQRQRCPNPACGEWSEVRPEAA